MPVTQQGAINTTALYVPDVYVQIVPPSENFLNGVPTNVLGVVGTASWGAVNAPTIVGSLADYVQKFGNIQNRKYDLGTAVWAAVLNGANNMRCVRVTDGTDTAASATVQTNCLTLTGIYTGSLGNNLQAAIATGSAASTTKVTLTLPGLVPEVFDNLSNSIASLTVTAGTGYTAVPTLSIAAPTGSNPVQATASASLTVISATQAVGGTGYAVNDTVTLSNGVILKVTTVTTGAITGVSVQAGGSLTSGNTPTNPVAQVSTSGAGTGGTFTLTWGLGAATLTNAGNGYLTAPTVTLTGGAGSGGSYTAVISVWQNIANAINNGQSGLRGKSQLMVAAVGAGTAAPVNATIALSGGTDGVGTITGSTLLGVDTVPRKGMYALRGTGSSVAMLADCDDSTTWTNQVSYGLSEGTYMIATGPAGDTIANATSTKATAGIDSYAMKLMFGDWCYFQDTVNGVTRLISPQGFIAGRLSGLSPEQSSLNKPLYGVVGTQKSYQNLTYSQAELQSLAQAGIDLIANPIPAGNSFGGRLGVNTSSNAVINGDNYTRLTNYVAYTLNAGMGLYVGKLQSPKVRNDAFGTVNAFLSNMWQQGQIGDVNNPQKQPFSVQLDANNNPSSRVALGYMQIDARITYLSVITKLLINVEGGQSVRVSVANITPQ